MAIEPNYSCGVCPLCREGNKNLCLSRTAVGIDVDGGFAQEVALPAHCCWPAPAGIERRSAPAHRAPRRRGPRGAARRAGAGRDGGGAGRRRPRAPRRPGPQGARVPGARGRALGAPAAARPGARRGRGRHHGRGGSCRGGAGAVRSRGGRSGRRDRGHRAGRRAGGRAVPARWPRRPDRAAPRGEPSSSSSGWCGGRSASSAR